jgi:hypothetical protein
VESRAELACREPGNVSFCEAVTAFAHALIDEVRNGHRIMGESPDQAWWVFRSTDFFCLRF